MGNPMELDKFIVDTDEWIDDVLASVGWTRDHVLQVFSSVLTRNL
jgi:hypothetical protein